MGLLIPTWIFLITMIFVTNVLGDQCFRSSSDGRNYFRGGDDTQVTTNNENVCSTWGNGHYQTFDGHYFSATGNCTYVFARDCSLLDEDFRILIHRTMIGSESHVNYITMQLFYQWVEANQTGIYVNHNKASIPYKGSNLHVDYEGIDFVFAINGIRITWNGADRVQVKISNKYKNHTCGLCGDSNGFYFYNEGIIYGDPQSLLSYLEENTAGAPGEVCDNNVNIDEPSPSCSQIDNACINILNSPDLADCVSMFDVKPYLEICNQDSCACNESDSQKMFCICATLSEFSKQCAIANGIPQNWRNPKLCAIECPSNREYRECGSPCEKTCSNQDVGVCIEKCVTGCYCPEGTVYDDVTETGCIPVSQCFCKYSGVAYATGDSLSLPCENCTCQNGLWNCVRKPCPGLCSVEGGAHIATFDQRLYTFHGDCTYILAKLCSMSMFTVHGQIRPCVLNDLETCLQTVMVIMKDSGVTLVIRSNGEVTLNSDEITLPYSHGNLTVFEPTSFTTVIYTQLGVQLEITRVPEMQLYIYVSTAFSGKVCGLCGNFNDKQSDDFVIPGGISVQDLSTFTHSWRSDHTCGKVSTDTIDPCAINIQKAAKRAIPRPLSITSFLHAEDGTFDC